MTKAITTAVTKALQYLDAQDAQWERHLDAIAVEVEGKTRTEVSALITPTIASHYGCATPEGGLDNKARGYEAAKKRRQRILGGLFPATGKANAQKSALEIAVEKHEAARAAEKALTAAEHKKFLRLTGQA